MLIAVEIVREVYRQGVTATFPNRVYNAVHSSTQDSLHKTRHEEQRTQATAETIPDQHQKTVLFRFLFELGTASTAGDCLHEFPLQRSV